MLTFGSLVLSAQLEIEKLRVKASENSVKIHEIQRSNEIASHVGTIRQLRAEKIGLEKELEKKAAELSALMNGRRPTRGTSVPRSPRMGGAVPSPGPARAMGRVLQMGGVGGNGSRGNSPASGDLAAGRAYNFGEILYGQPPTGSRFGNHLQ